MQVKIEVESYDVVDITKALEFTISYINSFGILTRTVTIYDASVKNIIGYMDLKS